MAQRPAAFLENYESPKSEVISPRSKRSSSNLLANYFQPEQQGKFDLFLPVPVKESEPDQHENVNNSSEVEAETKYGRKPGAITHCKHTYLKHFAKGMCNHCYHRFGREAMADKCAHTDRKRYAKGKCQNCYINDYNKAKRLKFKEETVIKRQKTAE